MSPGYARGWAAGKPVPPAPAVRAVGSGLCASMLMDAGPLGPASTQIEARSSLTLRPAALGNYHCTTACSCDAYSAKAAGVSGSGWVITRLR